MSETMTGTCAECGDDCSADREENSRAFHAGEYDGALPGAPGNPGRDAWEEALEDRHIDRDALLCPGCLSEVNALAWKICDRDDS